jgi:hypothetical protein
MLGLIIPLGVPGGGSPDQSLPGQPGHPSQGLPGSGGHPSQGLPGGGGHPSQGLPGQGGSGSTLPTDEAWILAYSPRGGYSWVKASDLVGSGHRPGQELPGGPPGHASGQPLPGGEHGSTQPVPGQPPHASGQPVPGQPNTPSNQPGGPAPKK